MSTAVVVDGGAVAARPAPAEPADIVLLGCGTVGAAVARLVSSPHPGRRLRIINALVRDARRARDVPRSLSLTSDAAQLFARHPQVVVELLGGVTPSRALVLEALSRGIAVVTANKSLLARHGRELREASLDSGAPLLCEAAVIAGVPFLGTFGRRPFTSATRIEAIANGTSNYILSALAHGREFEHGLADAQRLGYAEPDPSNDVNGTDSAEKLAVLLQQFGGVAVDPDAVETCGIARVSRDLAADAQALGGVVKPVIVADWSRQLEAYAGPAFVSTEHALARVDGVENALLLHTSRGRLRFEGPGAGPEVTAATVLDDVHEVVAGVAARTAWVPRSATATPLETGWLISLEGTRLPHPLHLADYFASSGIYARRTSDRSSQDGRERQALLTWPTHREPLERALDAFSRATGAHTAHVRTLESRP